MKNEMSKNMEIMKKVIDQKKEKSSKQKNTKRPAIYGTQSAGAGNIK
ncbi:hypothetical protein K9O30_07695 [Clostridium bowmanii]|nr:hypothetical protein [Clostridium bowmanii]MBU3188977.1 hypothetical protein [Clostridium bowmanii]MCA1073612.1 hypothetical protein [Clostridium bowmanii]